MKKILALVLAALLAVTLISCTNEKKDDTANTNDEVVSVVYEDVDLVAVADSLYDGIAEDNRPFVMSMPVEDAEMFSYFTFIPYEEGLEAVANEPMMSSIAHSIVLVKAPTIEKAAEVAEAMKANCDPRKWMCVEADIVEGVTNGNIAMLLMTTKEGGMAETILGNFKALDAEKIASLKSQVVLGNDDVMGEEAFEDETVDIEAPEAEMDDVVAVLPEVDAGNEPAAGFEEENVPAAMPEVEVEAVPEEDKASDAEALYMLAEKLYEGINIEEMPMVGTMELTEENFEYSAFVPYKASYTAVENMPMMGSVPHSVVIVKTESEEEAKALAAEMEKNANPRKWICVQARSVKSAYKGNTAILVMTSVEVFPEDDIDEAKAEEMSAAQSEERANIIIGNFLANA